MLLLLSIVSALQVYDYENDDIVYDDDIDDDDDDDDDADDDDGDDDDSGRCLFLLVSGATYVNTIVWQCE